MRIKWWVIALSAYFGYIALKRGAISGIWTDKMWGILWWSFALGAFKVRTRHPSVLTDPRFIYRIMRRW